MKTNISCSFAKCDVKYVINSSRTEVHNMMPTRCFKSLKSCHFQLLITQLIIYIYITVYGELKYGHSMVLSHSLLVEKLCCRDYSNLHVKNENDVYHFDSFCIRKIHQPCHQVKVYFLFSNAYTINRL